MNRAFHFELIKLWRRRTAGIALAVTTVFAVGSSALLLASAEPARPGVGGGPGLTVEELAAAGGGTQVFATSLAFAGFFVLVLFTGAMAAEFSRGNIRTMVLRQPARLQLLGGKLAALLCSAAVLLALAEVLGWTTARLLAGSQGVDASAWTSVHALAAGAADYGTVLVWVTGYALLGTALAVVVRSVPVALAIGIAWAGPFEHILADAWSGANSVFPGLLLEAFVAGGPRRRLRGSGPRVECGLRRGGRHGGGPGLHPPGRGVTADLDPPGGGGTSLRARAAAYCSNVTECRRRPPGTDVALTLALTAFTLVGTAGAASGQDDALRGIDVVGFVLAALSAIPFVVRRGAPVAGTVASALAAAVYFAAGYAFGPVLIALGLITASMAAALPLSRALRAGVAPLALLMTGLVIRFAREPDESGAVGLLAAPAWLVVPFAIGVVVGLNSENRARNRRDEADRAIHAERLRIAAEVHDVAGHGLAVIAMQAGVALHVLERKPEQARIALEEIRAASTEALDGLRTTLDSLRATDAPLTPGLPGLADLPALADRISRAGVAVDLRSSGQAVPVFPAVDHTAYRIVQESLTNVLRHANAQRVQVTAAWGPGELRLSVRDDGAGATGAEGGGIAGMRARAASVGGTLDAAPLTGGGFEVRATLPLGAP